MNENCVVDSSKNAEKNKQENLIKEDRQYSTIRLATWSNYAGNGNEGKIGEKSVLQGKNHGKIR